jgi:hypothetical protein
MDAFIAVVAFLLLVYVTFRWFRLLIIKYQLTESAIRITIFGLPIFRIPYRHIQACEFVQASNLWKPNSFLSFPLWLHTRLFVDGVMIKGKWRRYVLTPDNPEEFVKLVTQRQQVSRQTV